MLFFSWNGEYSEEGSWGIGVWLMTTTRPLMMRTLRLLALVAY